MKMKPLKRNAARTTMAPHGIVATERGDRRIRRATAAVVVMIAAFAAYISYRHAYELSSQNGEGAASAWAFPLTIDGLIFSSSMVILRANRHGMRVPFMAWFGMALGILATLGANVAHGVPYGVVGMATSAWPAIALVVSFEMLMRLLKPVITGESETASAPETTPAPVADEAPAPMADEAPAPMADEAPAPVAEPERPTPALAPRPAADSGERYAVGLAAYHESVVRPGRPLSQRDLAAAMGLKNRDLAIRIIREYKAAEESGTLNDLLLRVLGKAYDRKEDRENVNAVPSPAV